MYTAADFELDERHVIKNEKVALDRLRVRQNVFLVESILIKDLYKRRPKSNSEIFYSSKSKSKTKPVTFGQLKVTSEVKKTMDV